MKKPFRVTVRRGPKVSHEDYETLNQALAAVGREARGDRRAVEALGRTYEPSQLVAARIELKGAGRLAGVDVRGDGSLVAWTEGGPDPAVVVLDLETGETTRLPQEEAVEVRAVDGRTVYWQDDDIAYAADVDTGNVEPLASGPTRGPSSPAPSPGRAGRRRWPRPARWWPTGGRSPCRRSPR